MAQLIQERKEGFGNMKSIKLAALCLAATFALSALSAETAFAEGQPEFVKCVKVAKGKYNNKTCSEENVKGEGKYERAGATGTKFNGKSKAATFVTKSTGGTNLKVVCKKGTVAGEITGASAFSEKVKFEDCEANGSKTDECGNVGAGTIEGEVTGSLYYTNEAETETGVVTHSPLGEEVECGGEAVEPEGLLVGSVTGTSKGATISYAASGGHQADQYFFHGGKSYGPYTLDTQIEGEPGQHYESSLTDTEALGMKGVGILH